MKVTRENRHYDEYWQTEPTVTIETKDWGVSFADILGECGIEGHNPIKQDGYGDGKGWEKCNICKMERTCERKYKDEFNSISCKYIKTGYDVYGEWKSEKYTKCYECEDNCIISRPLDKIISCEECGGHGLLDEIEDKQLGFICEACGHEQIVA